MNNQIDYYDLFFSVTRHSERMQIRLESSLHTVEACEVLIYLPCGSYNLISPLWEFIDDVLYNKRLCFIYSDDQSKQEIIDSVKYGDLRSVEEFLEQKLPYDVIIFYRYMDIPESLRESIKMNFEVNKKIYIGKNNYLFVYKLQ